MKKICDESFMAVRERESYTLKINGITLIALVITIIILLILAGITISQLTGSDLFKNAKLTEQKSKEAQEKQDEILLDYENMTSKYINGTEKDEYVGGTREEDYVTREEYNALQSEIEKLKDNSSSVAQNYVTNFSNVSIATANAGYTVASITLPAGKYVLVGVANYQGTNLRYYISLAGANSSAYDNSGYVSMNVTDIVDIKVQTTYNLTVYASKSITTSGFIKAIKIGN